MNILRRLYDINPPVFMLGSAAIVFVVGITIAAMIGDAVFFAITSLLSFFIMRLIVVRHAMLWAVDTITDHRKALLLAGQPDNSDSYWNAILWSNHVVSMTLDLKSWRPSDFYPTVALLRN